MFALTARKNRLAVEQQELLTSGASEVFYCQISFDADWDGMTREVVFRAGSRSIAAKERDGLYVIPWEVLEMPMQNLYVGVRGLKGETVVLPTVWANLGYIAHGVTHGDNALPPTPDLVTQVLTKADAAKREAQAAAEKAETAAVHPPYPSSDTRTWWVWDNEIGSYVDSGQTTMGVPDHAVLTGRDAGDQHPIGSITDLKKELNDRLRKSNVITALDIIKIMEG